MQKFDRTDEGNDDENRMPSERLQAFTKALWAALVPAHGECASVQGELIRANDRLQGELLCNGMGNYFGRASRSSHSGTTTTGGSSSSYSIR